ncbi:Uncharacterised protein [Acinetobacter baumannii]|nr:Uncharacterised protein [Acinetobacter baumannii]
MFYQSFETLTLKYKLIYRLLTLYQMLMDEGI